MRLFRLPPGRNERVARWLFAATVTIALVSAACGSSGPPATPTPAPTPTPELPAGAVLYEIELKTAAQHDLTIKVGESILWTNVEEGFVLHSSVQTPLERGIQPEWSSINLNPGEHFRHTFDKLGEFRWVCRTHPDTERAVITVVAE